jgi:hypothetical protein
LNYRWLTALSIIGILLGIVVLVYEFTFYVWGCFGTGYGPCQPPFSYYLYVYYIPFAIIGVSVVSLVWSLRLQRRLNVSGIDSANPFS